MAKRILLIEDDALMTSILSRELTQAGFELDHAITGKNGFEAIERARPDLILLDIILPEMNGLEFLERFKASPDLRAIPVIIISNLGSRDDVDKGLAMGADAYLVKSNIFPEDVIRKVNAVLRKNNEG